MFFNTFATVLLSHQRITMSKVKVGLVQMSCSNSKEANLEKAIEKIKEAAGKGSTNRLPAGIVYFTLFL